MEEQNEQSSEPPPESSVTIQCKFVLDVAWLETKTQEALAFLGRTQSTISISIVDDKTMSDLHARHSGIEGTTDVLTFDNSSGEDLIEADIAVCVDVASRVAHNRGHGVESELMLYIVHGILHCMGFDDHNEQDHTRMHQEEDRVLEQIGVGAIWSKGI